MFLISRTGWTKNGIYKGQTLVQWGEGYLHRNFRHSDTGHACRLSKNCFDNNASDRKRCIYLTGCFKTSSKSRNIKLLVNSRYYTPPPFTCKPLNMKSPILSLLLSKLKREYGKREYVHTKYIL